MASSASRVVRSVLDGARAQRSGDLGVLLPRRDVPLYLMPSSSTQPWDLLPMKAAAYAEVG